MKLHDRSALITGASQGLGRTIARRYVEEGASVLVCARDGGALEALKAELLDARRDPGQQVLVHRADVSSTIEVDELFDYVEDALPDLDILVTNAGVYGPMGLVEDVDWAEWVKAVEINLLGTVYPCRRAMPIFRRRGRGKIICISGGGATNPLPRITAYAASKAAVVRFAESLALEAREDGIDVNSVAPGALMTQMMDQLLAAGPERVGEAFHKRMEGVAAGGGVPLETPANLCVYLGSRESDGISGRLISAQWDPWETLHAHSEDLSSSDIYTLRRIVPAERGQTWGER